jgi:hypothetical protein
MRAIVVQDQMHVQAGLDVGLDRVEELSELTRSMPLVEGANDAPVFTSKAAKSEVVPCRR